MATRTYSSITGQPVVLPAVFEVEQVSTYSIAATTSNPTPGTATYLRTTSRDGEYAVIKWEFAQTVAGSAGTGSYRLGMPTGLTINSAKVLSGGVKYVGSGRLDGTSSYVASAFVSGTEIGIILSNETQTPTQWSATLQPMSTTSIQFTIICRIPITEWIGQANLAYGAGLATSVKPGLLNWYEEGTFTPVVTASGTSGTVTHGTQVGAFTRIGRRVFFTVNITWTNWTGSPTGGIIVGGLPYTQKNTTNLIPNYTVLTDNISLPASGLWLVGQGNVNSNYMFIYAGKTAANSVAVDPASNAGAATRGITVSGSYDV